MQNNRRFARYLAAVLCAALLAGMSGMAGAAEITYPGNPPLVSIRYDTNTQKLFLTLDSLFDQSGVKPSLTLQTFSVSAVEGIHFTALNTQIDFSSSYQVELNAGVTPKAAHSMEHLWRPQPAYSS